MISLSVIIALGVAQVSVDGAGRIVIPNNPPRPSCRIVLLAGQSNAEGRPAATTVLGNYATQAPDHSRAYYWVTNSDWSALLPSAATVWGTELYIGRAGSNMAVVKVTRGGTSLASDWATTNTAGLRLFSAMSNCWATATNKLYMQGFMAPAPLAFVWLQGESDATNENFSASYAANLSNLVAGVRGFTQSSGLPCVIVRIHDDLPSVTYPYSSAVRAAQSNVAETLTGCQLVTTDDIANDGVHFTSAGLTNLGQRLAAIVAGLVP